MLHFVDGPCALVSYGCSEGRTTHFDEIRLKLCVYLMVEKRRLFLKRFGNVLESLIIPTSKELISYKEFGTIPEHKEYCPN